MLAAQAVRNAAAALDLSDVITTVTSSADAVAQLVQRPAEVILVDAAAVRPDTVGFTRRVLEHAPDAVMVFFGPEEPEVAQAALAAGARGLIRGGVREDLVASVAKALMLLLRPMTRLTSDALSQALPLQRAEPADTPDAAAAQVDPTSAMAAAVAANTANTTNTTGPAAVAEAAGNGTGATAEAASNGAATGAMDAVGATALRRLALTERELQVLRGMADGKSNAEIGRDLFVSEDTVKTHARRLFRKLDARDRAHAVAAAFRAGLVQ
jgi:DNA-binding NarL/FixJ family response regulator